MSWPGQPRRHSDASKLGWRRRNIGLTKTAQKGGINQRAKGIHSTKKERKKMRAMGTKNPTEDIINDAIKNNIISESDINLIKNRINRGEDVDLDAFYEKEGILLTPQQDQKGFQFLWDLYKTPTGKERGNNPFGWREQNVLENFDHFEVIDFYDATRPGGVKFVVPYYRVVSKEGDTFEYAFHGGQIHILG